MKKNLAALLGAGALSAGLASSFRMLSLKENRPGRGQSEEAATEVMAKAQAKRDRKNTKRLSRVL